MTEPPRPDDPTPGPPIDPVSQFSDPGLVNFYAESPEAETDYDLDRPPAYYRLRRRSFLPLGLIIGAILIALILIALIH